MSPLARAFFGAQLAAADADMARALAWARGTLDEYEAACAAVDKWDALVCWYSSQLIGFGCASARLVGRTVDGRALYEAELALFVREGASV